MGKIEPPPAIVNSVLEESQRIWETFATTGVDDEQPSDPIDKLQVELVRWQRNNFGDQTDERYAHGVIEEFSEALLARELLGNAGKIDGIGDMAIYSGQLLNNNRLAIRPVIQLAQNGLRVVGLTLFNDWGMRIKAVGELSHMVLKHAQNIRDWGKPEVYRLHLIDHIAWLLALAAQDAITHAEGSVVLPTELIAHAYIETANSVVLKRDWRANPSTGQLI